MNDGGAPAPVPRPVQEELERLGERWRTLPVAQALACAGRLRALAQLLADRVASRSGGPRGAIADLGPAAALDQLVVLVYDAASVGLAEDLSEQLSALRRSLP